MIVINIRQLITDYKYFQYFNKFNFKTTLVINFVFAYNKSSDEYQSRVKINDRERKLDT